MNKQHIELLNLMIEISEKGYCANWVTDLEFDLWKLVEEAKAEGFTKKKDYGQTIIEPYDLCKLFCLSNDAGGWWIFIDNLDYAFLLTEDWLNYYKNYKDRRIKYE